MQKEKINLMLKEKKYYTDCIIECAESLKYCIQHDWDDAYERENPENHAFSHEFKRDIINEKTYPEWC